MSLMTPLDELLVAEPHTSDNAHSPLLMVSQEPLLNELVLYLGRFRSDLQKNPSVTHELRFSRDRLRECRAAFDRMIIRGEEALHRLCELLCESFVGSCHLQSVANVVEYQPAEPNKRGVHKLISRIKAEEEIWNKVVDEIFGLDSLVLRDKQLRHLSRYVKDIFGIKIVVGSTAEATKLQAALQSLEWDDAALARLSLERTAETERLAFVETKSYLRDAEKQSGWEAVKSVVLWGGKMFEIQVQPLGNFWREREHLTRESHAGFKSRREQVRQRVAEQIPLFGFYQDLLRWLFQDPESAAPVFPGVSVSVVE